MPVELLEGSVEEEEGAAELDAYPMTIEGFHEEMKKFWYHYKSAKNLGRSKTLGNGALVFVTSYSCGAH